MGSGLVADIIVIPNRTRTACIWGLRRFGTKSSNPSPSSGESGTNQCPAFGIPIGAIFLLRWSPPSRTDKAPIKEKTPAEEAGFSKIGDRSRGGPSPQCHRRLVEPLRKRRNVGFVSYAGR